MITPRSARLTDSTAERVRRSHEKAIREIQAAPASGLKIIQNISVASGNSVTVAHGLGRAPRWIGVSAIRWDGSASIDAGTVFDRGTVDANGNTIDRTQVVVLAADNFTTAGSVTITFDLAVM